MSRIFSNKRRKLLGLAVALAVVLLIARAALPHWIKGWVNDQLASMGEYHGQIEDVDLQLWRGAYSIDKLIIEKRNADIPVPFIEVQTIDFSLGWRALFKGYIVASAVLHAPTVNFVDGEGDSTQSGIGVDWGGRLEGLAPFRLDEVRIEDGEIWFHNFTSDPPVDLKASNAQAVLQNLTNIQDKAERWAEFDLKADAFEDAPLEISGEFNPLSFAEDFFFKLKVTELELTRLNEFLRAYGNIDVHQGRGEFILELSAGDGRVDGYAKPLFREVEVFSWEQDIERQDDNPFRALWEALAGGLEDLLKNQEMNQIATRVDIEGTLDDPDTSALEAIKGILINAFVDAYQPVFEDLPAAEDAAE